MGVYAGSTESWIQLVTGATLTTIKENGVFYRVHSFRNVGINTFTVGRSTDVEYLLVGGGGGGGGGFASGGGGAGGFITGTTSIVAGSYSVVVGAGGSGGSVVSNGGSSSFNGISAAGGGYGGSNNGYGGATGPRTGNSGGSGGGGSGGDQVYTGNYPGASGNTPTLSPSQGNNGGSGNGGVPYGGGGGGGGGSLTVGSNAPEAKTGGAGGSGKLSSITGISTYYAGGGGGFSRADQARAGGAGGLGGGGKGSGNDGSSTAGSPNTGGGGGDSQSGGSGIVVLRYVVGAGSTIITVTDGSTSDKAAPSASYLVSLGLTTDGVYWIDLPTVGPTQIYCILNPIYDGGGWMMAMKATTGTTFNYSANYWTTANTLNPTENNRNNGDAKFNSMNYFQSNDMMAIWPDISNGGSIPSSTLGWTWLQNNFNDGTRITPISFFGITYPTMNPGGSGKFIRDAKTFSGWASGVFSSQADVRFYGFNYTDNPGYGTNARCRWGFGWNENGEGLYPSNNVSYIGSNDVSGGIGMDSGFGSYSAGDRINCCQDTTGINRSARVEIYVR